jgi:hypothetical protein
MIVPFKFFRGKVYTDEFEFPRIRRRSGRTIAQDLINTVSQTVRDPNYVPASYIPITQPTVMDSTPFLREYYRRLDYVYTVHYNMYGRDNPLFNESLSLYNRTVGFIEEGQLTNHNEIRRFVHNAYSDLVYGVFDQYEVDEATNQEIIVETYNFINTRT